MDSTIWMVITGNPKEVVPRAPEPQWRLVKLCSTVEHTMFILIHSLHCDSKSSRHPMLHQGHYECITMNHTCFCETAMFIHFS